jgi:hypothetical protein
MDGEIRVYRFNEESVAYGQVSASGWFPELDVQRLAVASIQEFRADAIQMFLT